MSDPQKPPSFIIEAQPSTAGRAIDTGGKLLTTLPPAFLLLCILNIALIYLVLSSIEHQLDLRTEILNRVISTCLTK